MFYSTQSPAPPRGNLLNSGGHFDDNEFGVNWHTVEFVASFGVGGEAVTAFIREPSSAVWHASLNHSAMVLEGRTYSICFDARAAGEREIITYVDTDKFSFTNISEGVFVSQLTEEYQSFHYVFTAEATDPRARLSFDMAQSALNVTLDNIGLYEGSECGVP